MTDLHELTEEFKAFAITEPEYRDALKAWGTTPEEIEEMQKMYARERASKDGIYS